MRHLIISLVLLGILLLAACKDPVRPSKIEGGIQNNREENVIDFLFAVTADVADFEEPVFVCEGYWIESDNQTHTPVLRRIVRSSDLHRDGIAKINGKLLEAGDNLKKFDGLLYLFGVQEGFGAGKVVKPIGWKRFMFDNDYVRKKAELGT